MKSLTFLLLSFFYKTSRFHVAMRLLGNRSAIASCAAIFFLPHFDVICDLLLNRGTATWNLFSFELKKMLKT